MAAGGFVKFATVALRIGRACCQPTRSRFSEHRFQSPQRLASLYLMCDEDCTVCEAEVRLAEHAARRAALGLRHVPDDTTVYRVLRRLDPSVLEQLLRAVVQRLVPRLDGQATVVVGATGLAPGAVSPFFVKQAKAHGVGLPWTVDYRRSWPWIWIGI
jgi:hypothetical protein